MTEGLTRGGVSSRVYRRCFKVRCYSRLCRELHMSKLRNRRWHQTAVCSVGMTAILSVTFHTRWLLFLCYNCVNNDTC